MKIAVIGSSLSQGYTEEQSAMAMEIARELASRGHTLLYGSERNMPSLPQQVAAGMRQHGGSTIAIAHGAARSAFHDPAAASLVIYTDCGGGAGREVVLINSADAVISLGGGSGTLAEIAIAYMNFIPVVSLSNSGGWSKKLAGTLLDNRKKFLIGDARTAREAIDQAESLYQRYRTEKSQTCWAEKETDVVNQESI